MYVCPIPQYECALCLLKASVFSEIAGSVVWRMLSHGIAGWEGPLLHSKSSSEQKKKQENTAYNAVSNLLLVQLFSVSVLFIVFKIGFN